MVYDSYGDRSIKGGGVQRDCESITHKHLEAPLCTDLNKTTAPITTHLKRYQAQTSFQGLESHSFNKYYAFNWRRALVCVKHVIKA